MASPALTPHPLPLGEGAGAILPCQKRSLEYARVHEYWTKVSVYNLKKLEDFNGNYTGVTAGATVAGGAGASTIQNQNGVVINLVGTSQGLKFKLSMDGVKMTLKAS